MKIHTDLLSQFVYVVGNAIIFGALLLVYDLDYRQAIGLGTILSIFYTALVKIQHLLKQ